MTATIVQSQPIQPHAFHTVTARTQAGTTYPLVVWARSRQAAVAQAQLEWPNLTIIQEPSP